MFAGLVLGFDAESIVVKKAKDVISTKQRFCVSAQRYTMPLRVIVSLRRD
jgi:hypothetical protein